MDVTHPQPGTAGLIDLSHLSLKELWSFQGDGALVHSIRRVIAPAEESPQPTVSAFNSAV